MLYKRRKCLYRDDCMTKSTLPPKAVIRAARTLERYEVRELLRVAPDRNASLAGPARLLDAIRAWRAVFDPPKVSQRRGENKPSEAEKSLQRRLDAAEARSHLEHIAFQCGIADTECAIQLYLQRCQGMSEIDLSEMDEAKFFSGLRRDYPHIFAPRTPRKPRPSSP